MKSAILVVFLMFAVVPTALAQLPAGNDTANNQAYDPSLVLPPGYRPSPQTNSNRRTSAEEPSGHVCARITIPLLSSKGRFAKSAQLRGRQTCRLDVGPRVTFLEGFIYISQLAIKQMVAKHIGGSIVSITTSMVEHPIAGVNASVPMITKGGLEAITRSLAMEYAKEAFA